MKKLALLLACIMLLCMPAMAQENTSPITISFSGQGDGQTTFAATWFDHEAAQAFAQLLPLTLTFSDLNGYEKFAYLDQELPECTEAVEQVQAGDIMLFGNKCLVIFYEDTQTPYNYTRIGRIQEISSLKNALGDWDITITFTP